MKHMKEYPSQDEVRELFDYKDGKLFWKKKISRKVVVGREAGCVGAKGYTHIIVEGKLYQAHRLIWIYHHGDIPEGLYVDHVNEIKDDNSIENLRLLNNKQNNSRSKKPSGKGKFLGVEQNSSGRYAARIYHEDREEYIGTFDTAEEAAKARDERVLQLDGRYATLNYNDDIIKFIDLVMHKAERDTNLKTVDASQWQNKPSDINAVKNSF